MDWISLVHSWILTNKDIPRDADFSFTNHGLSDVEINLYFCPLFPRSTLTWIRKIDSELKLKN